MNHSQIHLTLRDWMSYKMTVIWWLSYGFVIIIFCQFLVKIDSKNLRMISIIVGDFVFLCWSKWRPDTWITLRSIWRWRTGWVTRWLSYDDCHMGLHLNIYTMTLLYTTLLIHVSSFACHSFSEASSGLKALMYLWVSDCDNLPISITIFSNHNSCWNERGWQN